MHSRGTVAEKVIGTAAKEWGGPPGRPFFQSRNLSSPFRGPRGRLQGWKHRNRAATKGSGMRAYICRGASHKNKPQIATGQIARRRWTHQIGGAGKTWRYSPSANPFTRSAPQRCPVSRHAMLSEAPPAEERSTDREREAGRHVASSPHRGTPLLNRVPHLHPNRNAEIP